MKGVVALGLMSGILLSLTGCQSRPAQGTSNANARNQPSLDAGQPGPSEAREPAGALLVERYRFSFEGGSHYLTDTATGTVWNLSRGAWKKLPPLPAE